MSVESEYKKVQEKRMDSIINHFNGRWGSAAKALGKHRENPPTLARSFDLIKNCINASFWACSELSPNDVAICLSFELPYTLGFREGPIGDDGSIPIVKDIQRSLSCKRLGVDGGKLHVERRGALLFEAEFDVLAPDSTGSHRTTYLSDNVRLGRRDRAFLDFFGRELEELAFADKYPINSAINLAFAMYRYPPRKTHNGIPISYGLDSSKED